MEYVTCQALASMGTFHPGEAGRLSAYCHVSLSASTIPRQLCAPWASLSVVLATCLQTQHWALGSRSLLLPGRER